VARTWAPKGDTPVVRSLYKQDRLSAISALAVSPKRKRLALSLTLRPRTRTGLDVRAFLPHLFRHLRGPVVLLWDRGPIHRRREVQQWIMAHPRLQVEELPAYAPELNPAEYVWAQADRALANSAPTDLRQLNGLLRHSVRRIRGSPPLLWSCIHASDLPWAR
jgi:putative transposase